MRTQVAPFIVAQMFGAFFGAFLVWSVYFESLNVYDGGIKAVTGDLATAGVFSTYPQVCVCVCVCLCVYARATVRLYVLSD